MMAAFRLVRLVIAIYSIQVFASTECIKLDLESGEIAHGKPISATSTCGAFETYCYSRGKGMRNYMYDFMYMAHSAPMTRV